MFFANCSWPICRRPKGAVLGFAALLSLAAFTVFVPNARASQIPPSAESSSRNVDPEFVDNQGQLFRFPQWATVLDPQAFVLDTGLDGFGVVVPAGPVRMAVVQQKPIALGEKFGLVPHVYQAAAAMDIEGLRFGAAVRAGHRRFVEEDLQSNSSRDYDARSLLTTPWEISGGLGWSSKRLRLDWSFAAYSEKLDQRVLQLSASDTSGASSTTADSWEPELAFRGELQLGRLDQVRLFGTIHTRRQETDFQSIKGDSTTSFKQEPLLQTWTAGVAWIRRLNRRLELTTSATSSNVRTSSIAVEYYDANSRRSFTQSHKLGTSLTYRVSDSWTAFSGIRTSFSRQSDHRELILSRYSSGSDSNDESDATSSTFGWGVKSSFRRVDFAASLDSNLWFDRLFPSISFAVKF